jgi:hypothetical protein
MNLPRLPIAAALIVMLSACGGGNSDAPAFNPVVSMNANISASELVINYTPYTTEYNAIYADGARGAQTAAPWSSLEPSPFSPTYDLTMISNPYFGLNALDGYGYTSILINIPIVAIGLRTMPADIIALPFNNTTVITRFHLLLDQFVPSLKSSVKYISLGNEVDTYFKTHGGEVSEYKALIEDARTYIHTLKPNIKVGVTTTFDGFVGNASAQTKSDVASLNANMDVIILTYYPTGAAFVPRDPSTVSTDMTKMINVAAGKPLVMQEWGYPSSSILSPLPLDSEQMQADFITNTFTSWRQYGSARIPFISFFKWRDWDQAQCTALTSGKIPGDSFYEFMCSLGLLNNDTSSKLAYSALTTELSNIGP